MLIYWRPDAAVLHEASASKLTRQAAAAAFRKRVSNSFMVPLVVRDSAALVGGVVGVRA